MTRSTGVEGGAGAWMSHGARPQHGREAACPWPRSAPEGLDRAPEAGPAFRSGAVPPPDMRLTYSRGSLGRRDPASPGAGSSEPSICLSNTRRCVFPRADNVRKMSPGRKSKYNMLEENVGPKRKLLSLGKKKKEKSEIGKGEKSR